MTNTVVVDSVQTVVTQSVQPSIVVAQTSPPKTIVTGMMGPRGAHSTTELTDLDISSRVSGSLLVYNAQINKWAASTVLDEQVIECGEY